MKKDPDEKNSILKALEDMLKNDSPHPDKESSEDNSEKKTPKFNDRYTPRIHQQVEELGNTLRDAGLPFLITVNYDSEPGIDDEGHTGMRYNLFTEGYHVKDVCEYVAALEILNMPHEFSHLVIDMAGKLRAMFANDDHKE